MEFVISVEELNALCGLPHIQQLAYLRGIRPYMDVKTKVVGIRRRISYQSIAEQLYIEPHQGIKSQSFSRDQVRRAVAGLARTGIIEVQSEGMQLLLKCRFATQHFSVQNKAAINPPQKGTINRSEQKGVNTEFPKYQSTKADTVESQKAATPQDNNNYLYLLNNFDQFWNKYPEKKSKEQAWQAFQALNPDDTLFNQMMQALELQITDRVTQSLAGQWLPPWKYPATWLLKRSFEDELTQETPKEKRHASRGKNTRDDNNDLFWNPTLEEEQNGNDESPNDNVISFSQYQTC